MPRLPCPRERFKKFPATVLAIEVSNLQGGLPVDEPRLAEAVRMIFSEAGVSHGEVSIAVVDDETIHGLNRRHLDHDEPTDVLSFLLEREADRLDGELVVSADTAARCAGQFGWSAAEELLLYTIHGALHLVGLDDATADERRRMRRRERQYLRRFGIEPRDQPGEDDSHRPLGAVPDGKTS